MKSMSGIIKFYTPSTKPSLNSIVINNKITGLMYYASDNNKNQQKTNLEHEFIEYQGFPFVVNENGSLWRHATLFLLWKIKNNSKLTSDRLKQYAIVLQDFKRFCEKENIDYLVAKRKWIRPNWKYREFLKENNAKQLGNKMKNLSAFFDFLIDVEGIQYDVALWNREEGSMLIPTGNGNAYIKNYSKKDVDYEPKTKNDFDGYVRDGEKMRPMSEDEQLIFDEVMIEHSNTELFLSSMIALNTAARKQTIFTLRLKHFVDALPPNYDKETIEKWFDTYRSISNHSDKTIMVGYKTGADTKNEKQFLLYFPGWLYKTIVIYLVSIRACRRRSKALSQYCDLDQYLFLTRASRPYYHAKDDINLKAYLNIEKGNSINVAMLRFRKELHIKCLELNKSKFPIRFHDLRATYGMNYLDANENLIDTNEVTWSDVLRGLARRMAHDDIRTTQGYLDLKRFNKLKPKLQTEYEESRMEAIYDRINYS